MLLKAPLLALSLLTGFVVAAQPVVRYQFTHLSPDQGLSSTYARKIVQDPYGFIWAGTQDGLNRFDGKKISTYNKNNTNHSIAGADIRDLTIDTARTTLWVLTSYGGINGIDYRTGKVWFSFDQTSDRRWANTLLNSLALVNDTIYIGSSNGLLQLSINEKSLRRIPFVPAIDNADVFIDRLVPDGPGAWVMTEAHGIYYIALSSGEPLSQLSADRQPRALRTHDAVCLQPGELLLATNHGIQKLQRRNQLLTIDSLPFPYLPKSFCRETFACCREQSGNILLSNGQQLIRVNTALNSYTILQENTSADTERWLSAVFAIYVDQQQTLWLGCQQGLAFGEAFPSPFYRVYQSAQSTTRIEHAYFICPINDTLLYACAQDGLYKVNTANGVITALAEGKPFYHVFKTQAGDYLASSREGTFLLVNDRLTPITKRYPELAKEVFVFNSHVQLNDSVMVLGTHNFKGVVVWNFRRHTASTINNNYSFPVLLKENTVNGLYLDSHQKIWVLGDQSITILNKTLTKATGLLPHNPYTGRHYSIFFDVVQIGRFIYLASYGNGIAVLEDSTYRYVRSMMAPGDLSANSTYKLFAWRDSLLFATSNNGITVTDIQKNTPPVFFYKPDGLHSNTFEEYSGSSYHDKLYAGGDKGLTIIHPALFRSDSTAPRLYLDELQMESTDSIRTIADLGRTAYEIPNDVVQTTLYFSAIHYQRPTKTTLAYKIAELNDKWISLGANNFIQLIGIPPGSYTLYVKATNSNGIETITPLQISLRFLPKWYQTWWFKTLLTLLAVAMLYTIYWYRLLQLKKREAIRRKLAADLHDDIGSTLTSIALRAHMAKTQPQGNEHLVQLEESVKQTSASLRDMIWVLDDTADTILEFMERLKVFAQPLCHAKGIELKLRSDADTGFTELGKEEKRNLMLIAKEAINNAIKYAGCSQLLVEFELGKRQKRLTITDNGKGFNSQQKSAGFGLRTMQNRAKELKGTLTIQSSAKGTVVALVIKHTKPWLQQLFPAK